MAGGARPATIEFGLNIGLGEDKPRGTAVDHAANGRAVGLSKRGHRKEKTKGIA